MISVSTRLDLIVGFAARKRLPAIYQFREYAVAGGLISYGPNLAESYKNASRAKSPPTCRSCSRPNSNS